MRIFLSLLFFMSSLTSNAQIAVVDYNSLVDRSTDAFENLFEYNDDYVHEDAHIFLIAGSKDGANFSQEIIEQKKHWLSLGYKPSEIACYYVIPDEKNYFTDKKQYDSLAEDLKDCHKASMKRISDDLYSVNKDKPLYLYISSHGMLPLSKYIERIKENKKSVMEEILKRVPELDEYIVTLDATPDQNENTSNLGEIMRALDQNEYTSKELLFTPENLKELLKEWPEEIKKIMVIQSCYSGGFVGSKDPKFLKKSLRDIPNITIMTASRYDRTSFGCNPSSIKTYYGNAFNKALISTNTTLDQISWNNIFNEVRSEVLKLEEDLEFKPSLPQFFQN